MKALKFLFLLIFVSCSSSKVVVDYDDKTDFSIFKTFDFYEDNGESLNDFDINRISDAILQNLKTVGLQQDIKPDFFIYFDAKISEKQNNNTIGIGIGSASRNGGIGVSGGIPIGGEKLIEDISIRFIAATSNELFWEGSLSSSIKKKRTPEKRKLYITEVIAEILQNYPPKNK
ncbi:DUF4136 domain-containing protein [Polaribacter sp. SA4-12]|uniref:DUF4136 domain-containing protein n=1 Tax=Polaribacter sp. SA4-12 TaxID=1312072 RepID=UPI000B3C213D|nr:DUF4136 domain-containing protein [Polaribacter sp. SA4-12]ARV16659.1 hypothetical protein BTO07_16610 [Polaribacter sp. SA4-12]